MSARLPPADIQFISEFAAFCRTKGDEGYDNLSPGSCALAKFGRPGVVTDNRGTHDRAGNQVPHEAYRAAALCDGPYTFSALADRLDALLVDSPVVERVL